MNSARCEVGQLVSVAAETASEIVGSTRCEFASDGDRETAYRCALALQKEPRTNPIREPNWPRTW